MEIKYSKFNENWYFIIKFGSIWKCLITLNNDTQINSSESS